MIFIIVMSTYDLVEALDLFPTVFALRQRAQLEAGALGADLALTLTG